MKAVTLFDYVADESVETGLNVGVVFEKNSEDVGSDFVPNSFDHKSSWKRIATYVDWYTEMAWLFIEDGGIGFERMKEVFDALEDEGFNPYSFEEVVRSYPGQIKIEESENEIKVIDNKENRYFSTKSTDNPIQMNNTDKNNTPQ